MSTNGLLIHTFHVVFIDHDQRKSIRKTINRIYDQLKKTSKTHSELQ